MPIGVIVNCSVGLIGCFVEVLIARYLSPKLKENLPLIFGFCAMAIGIRSIVGAGNITVVVLAVLLGYCIGQILQMEKHVSSFF